MWCRLRRWGGSHDASHEGGCEGGHAAWEMWVRPYDVSHVAWNTSHDASHVALICDWGHMMHVTLVGGGHELTEWQGCLYTIARTHKQTQTNTNKQHHTQHKTQNNSETQHTKQNQTPHKKTQKTGVSYPPFYGASRGLVGCGSSHVAYSLIGH